MLSLMYIKQDIVTPESCGTITVRMVSFFVNVYNSIYVEVWTRELQFTTSLLTLLEGLLIGWKN